MHGIKGNKVLKDTGGAGLCVRVCVWVCVRVFGCVCVCLGVHGCISTVLMFIFLCNSIVTIVPSSAQLVCLTFF